MRRCAVWSVRVAGGDGRCGLLGWAVSVSLSMVRGRVLGAEVLRFGAAGLRSPVRARSASWMAPSRRCLRRRRFRCAVTRSGDPVNAVGVVVAECVAVAVADRVALSSAAQPRKLPLSTSRGVAVSGPLSCDHDGSSRTIASPSNSLARGRQSARKRHCRDSPGVMPIELSWHTAASPHQLWPSDPDVAEFVTLCSRVLQLARLREWPFAGLEYIGQREPQLSRE